MKTSTLGMMCAVGIMGKVIASDAGESASVVTALEGAFPQTDLCSGEYPGRWVGRFIWDKQNKVPPSSRKLEPGWGHEHLMLRKTFVLAAIDNFHVWPQRRAGIQI